MRAGSIPSQSKTWLGKGSGPAGPPSPHTSPPPSPQGRKASVPGAVPPPPSGPSGSSQMNEIDEETPARKAGDGPQGGIDPKDLFGAFMASSGTSSPSVKVRLWGMG